MITVWVRLEIGGDDADEHAYHALNEQLDAGALQDPIEEAGYDLKVITATVESPLEALEAAEAFIADDTCRHDDEKTLVLAQIHAVLKKA